MDHTPSHAPAARSPSTLVDRLSVAGGREVVVRPVQAQDANAAQAFVRALSPAARHKRFHMALRELPPSLLRAMTEVDHRDHVAIVAEAIDADEGSDDDKAQIVADARYVRIDGTDDAEFAIVVADKWQGRGLGRSLLQCLARHAARRGVRSIVGDVLYDNGGMFALATAMGARREASPSGVGVVRMRISLDA